MNKSIDDKMEDLNEREQKILKEFVKANYKPSEVKNLIESLRRQNNKSNEYSLGRKNIKIGVFGDSHIGNINYDRNLFNFMSDEFKKEKVNLICCAGDIMDGWYQNRPASLFEQNRIGLDQQLEMTVEDFSKFEKPLYFITGNHEYNTFMRGAGIEVGNYLEEKLNSNGIDSHFLGNMQGDLVLKNGQKIRMLHPDGGSSYALSYKPQKIIESLEGGDKPNIMLIGHYHKALYMFYRNVHTFMTGTLMGQSKFMKGRGLAAHKGFYILNIKGDNLGDIDRITPQFYPAYR